MDLIKSMMFDLPLDLAVRRSSDARVDPDFLWSLPAAIPHLSTVGTEIAFCIPG